MGTRIQDKSRPTKRPMATVDVSGNYVKVRSGKPALDLKGYPRTDGISVPVLVRGAVLAPPAGLAPIGGAWRAQVTASAANGVIAVDGTNFTIADRDEAGTDVSAAVQALVAGQKLWTTDAFNNTWEATVVSVTDGTGVTTIVFSGPVGTWQVGEGIRFAAGTPT
jgi:hypothetical protein